MKKLALLGVVLMMGSSLTIAAEETKPPTTANTTQSQPTKKKMKKAKAMYKCEHCGMTSNKPGKCSMCNVDMKKV